MKIVELDHEVYERLQDLSIALVEPNLSNVIKIIDKLNSSKKTKLPGKYYRKQIIKALEELGGRAHLEDVLELTFKRIRHVLTHIDLTDDNWRKTALWEYHLMLKDKIAKPHSEKTNRGIWELNLDYN